ncbi:ABC transporter permease [Catellatospora methionotrophica]|uniref:ABC transporter permease n=1 Tax=Catellatospora methionotrophica TaxID=121620 RepID=A0A8J3L698_9ACTN|nr:carbohydrate ABC transporter permease [Catellatospora methionotrophica]GIG12523.1 ABC transporter permease [Catellatospora methionotrophica]
MSLPVATPGTGRLARAATVTVLVVVLLVLAYPLLWILASSLRSAGETATGMSLWPQEFTWSNYAAGWSGINGVGFGRFFLNSTVVAVGAVTGNVVTCLLAAFAFARLRFPLRRFWYAIVIGTLLLPQHVLMVPQYMIFRELGWLNTPLPLIVPKLLAADSFFIFLIVQFLRSLPESYDEYARADGASPWQLFRHVILPLSRPAITATAILTFIWTWNDFFPQLVYLPMVEDSTAPSGLHQYAVAGGLSAPGPMFAMAVLSLLPVLLFFVAFQRHLTSSAAPGRMAANLSRQRARR